MAWPANITRVPVVHHVTNYAGDPIAGTATFTPPAGLITDLTTTPPTQVAPSEITGTYVVGELLAADGVSALTLPALNDPDVLPNGGRYTVTLKFSNGTSPAAFYIEIDYQATEYDLATVVHQPGPSGGTIIVVPGDLSGYQTRSEKGQASGYASLGSDGKVPSAQLPTGGGGGAGTVTSVAGVDPDGTGNVPLTAGDIDAATTEDLASGLSGKADTDDLDSLPYAKTVNGKSPNGSGAVTLVASDVSALPSSATAATIGAATAAQGAKADTALQDSDGSKAKIIAGAKLVIYRNETAGTYALRNTVTADLTHSVEWEGTVAPTAGSGYAVNNVDTWARRPA